MTPQIFSYSFGLFSDFLAARLPQSVAVMAPRFSRQAQAVGLGVLAFVTLASFGILAALPKLSNGFRLSLAVAGYIACVIVLRVAMTRWKSDWDSQWDSRRDHRRVSTTAVVPFARPKRLNRG